MLMENSILIPLRAQLQVVQSSLLNYMLVDAGLMDHLKALRNYLLFHDGEFAHHLSTTLFNEINEATVATEILNPATLNRYLMLAKKQDFFFHYHLLFFLLESWRTLSCLPPSGTATPSPATSASAWASLTTTPWTSSGASDLVTGPIGRATSSWPTRPWPCMEKSSSSSCSWGRPSGQWSRST